MARSESSAARHWITDLKPGTWFYSTAIPGRAVITHPVLSRLHTDKTTGVWKVARGLYWRGYPEGHPRYGIPPDGMIGALMVAGPGAGLYGWSALNRLDWTLQLPVKGHVSVLGRKPAPIDCTIVYHSNHNMRRSRLNWTEVTVLEAVPMLYYSEEPWHECLERFRCGVSSTRLGWHPSIRPRLLEWAAETEKNVTVETLHKVGQIVSALSKTVPVAT